MGAESYVSRLILYLQFVNTHRVLYYRNATNSALFCCLSLERMRYSYHLYKLLLFLKASSLPALALKIYSLHTLAELPWSPMGVVCAYGESRPFLKSTLLMGTADATPGSSAEGLPCRSVAVSVEYRENP